MPPPETRQYRHIRPEPRRGGARGLAGLVLLLGVAVVAGAVYVLFLRDTGPSARDTLDGFVTTWSGGDDAGAARKTTAPAVAAKALPANRRGLDGAKLRATVLSVHEDGDRARGRVHLRWQVPQFGAFSYDTNAALRHEGKAGWQVVWDPKLVHPALDSGTRLGTAVSRPERGRILDRNGGSLVTARAVVRVGVARNKVTDPDATAVAMAKVVDVAPGSYARAIRDAGP